MVSPAGFIDFMVKLAGRAPLPKPAFRCKGTFGRKTIMKSMNMTRRGVFGAASALGATTVLGRRAQAAAEFDFRVRRQHVTN
jgi:hypothetical protein